MKVLIFTPVYPPNIAVGGGVAITYGALNQKLLSMGHEVEVLSPRLENVDHGTSILYKNFPVTFPTAANLYVTAKAIAWADVTVVPDDCNLPFLAYLCFMQNKPLLFNIHTNVEHLLSQRPEPVLKYFAAPLIGIFVTISSHISTRTYTTSPSYQEHLLNNKKCRVDGVFSPRIKLAVFTLEDSDEEVKAAREWLSRGNSHLPLMIVAGRISAEKRIELLAKAKPHNFVLAVVGDGPDAPTIKQLESIPNVFVHVGMQNQDGLRVLYKASDFLVSASAFETLGMTVAEAHMCGTPVAVQSAPGFVSQVIPGRNGFLVNYDDAEEARKQLLAAYAAKPSREQVLQTLDERWDAKLPDLQNVVLDLARAGRGSSWSWVFKALLTVFMIGYWMFYTVLTFPFNTLTNRVRRVDLGLKLYPVSMIKVAVREVGTVLHGRTILMALMLYAAKRDLVVF